MTVTFKYEAKIVNGQFAPQITINDFKVEQNRDEFDFYDTYGECIAVNVYINDVKKFMMKNMGIGESDAEAIEYIFRQHFIREIGYI